MTLTPILYVTLSGLFLDLYVCLKYFASAFEPYIIVTVQHYLLSHYEYNLFYKNIGLLNCLFIVVIGTYRMALSQFISVVMWSNFDDKEYK